MSQCNSSAEVRSKLTKFVQIRIKLPIQEQDVKPSKVCQNPGKSGKVVNFADT